MIETLINDANDKVKSLYSEIKDYGVGFIF
jgi:hypothetical protein